MPSELANANGIPQCLTILASTVRAWVPCSAKRISGKSPAWPILATLILTACSNPGADAEKRYHIVERNGSKNELCAAARAVVDVYLKAGDEKKYKEWQLYSSIHCKLASQTYGDAPSLESEAYNAAQAEASADARQAQKDAYDVVQRLSKEAEVAAAVPRTDEDAEIAMEPEEASGRTE